MIEEDLATEKPHKITLSVRQLAEPIQRRGSLSYESVAMGMEIGAEIHRRIQDECEKQWGEAYAKEVPFSATLHHSDLCFEVKGRADSVFIDKKLIEEIKSTHSLDRLCDKLADNPEHPYILQLKIYGYCYYQQHGELPSLSLLLVSTAGGRRRQLPIDYDHKAFCLWLERKLTALVALELQREADRQRRMQLAAELSFPFAKPRPQQDVLMAAVQKVVDAGKVGLWQAPTGIGKTLGVLFPSLKNALSRGAATIYLTPKNSQFEVVKQAVDLLHNKGHKLRLLVLTAKTKICLNKTVECNETACRFAAGYYDKLAEHQLVPESFAQQSSYAADKGHFTELAERLEVCPYELSFENLEWYDLIVCDYNYVASPRGGLAHLIYDDKMEGVTEGHLPKLNLIIDEAHNLYHRAREYYSPQISSELMLDVQLLNHRPNLPKAFTSFIHQVSLFFRHYTDGQSRVIDLVDTDVLELERRMRSLVVSYIEMSDQVDMEDAFFRLYFALRDFAVVLNHRKAVNFAVIRSGEDTSLKAICCDPAVFLRKIWQGFHGVVAFSATLKPFEFYRQLSGFPKSTTIAELPSSFPAANRLTLVIPQVSTAFRRRAANYGKICAAILKLSQINPGGYLVFLPSFEFMYQLKEQLEVARQNPALSAQAPKSAVFSQTRNGSPEDTQNLLTIMATEQRPFLLFAVQGGVLAEGVDVHNPNLKGAFVVGPALQAVSFENQVLSQFYQHSFGKGFAYTYVYPAMARSIQAAGRIIRDDQKKGLIVFLGQRFTEPDYAETLPSYWYEESPAELVRTGLVAKVERFWHDG